MNADYEVKCYSGTVRKQSELAKAFDLVADKTNWKLPIKAIVSGDGIDRELISDAVVHFTGSVPEFYFWNGGKSLRGDYTVFAEVTAAGYYATIGA